MACRSSEVQHASGIPIFDAFLRDLTIETIRDPDHPGRLCLYSWDGRKYAITASASQGGCTYMAAPIGTGLAQKIRFPGTSKQFGSATKLSASITEFLCHYARLLPDAAAVLVAFTFASWFADSLPVTPILYLLGPENEASLVLRLLGCVCRRPLLLPREEGASDFYCFSRRHGLEFPRDRVLNHVLLEDGVLSSGRPVRGWLLARGGPMPKSVKHGQWVEATLRIFASDHTEHTGELRLWTDRSEMKQNADLFKHQRRGAGLYGSTKSSLRGTAAFLSQNRENGTRQTRPKFEAFSFRKLREAANAERAAKRSPS
jgi:hypothetical protein